MEPRPEAWQPELGKKASCVSSPHAENVAIVLSCLFVNGAITAKENKFQLPTLAVFEGDLGSVPHMAAHNHM